MPADVWLWLNERPSLPPFCKGRRLGGDHDTIRTVRTLDDFGVLASYLIVIWPEWKPLDEDGFSEMRMSVCEDFNGMGNGHHRAELIQRLGSCEPGVTKNILFPGFEYVVNRRSDVVCGLDEQSWTCFRWYGSLLYGFFDR